MSEIKPSPYSYEALSHIGPPNPAERQRIKEQVLATGLGSAGLKIQDILLNTEVVYQSLGSSFQEFRNRGIEILIDNELNEVTVNQTRGPNYHFFRVRAVMPQDEGHYVNVIYLWGVDTPEDQKLLIQFLERTGGEVDKNIGYEARKFFTKEDIDTINLLLDAAKGSLD